MGIKRDKIRIIWCLRSLLNYCFPFILLSHFSDLGKSSLMVALFRLVEPAAGRILIDGVDTNVIGLETLRSNLSIIPQDSFLWSADLRYNLDPFNKCTDDEIHAVLERVHLSEMISQLPDGLRSPVSENGENFSAGTRQLICIARALLRKSKIIILDEATSSVDAETDTLIQETIRVNFANATVLTIAHRLETIVDADRIMLLADGKICECKRMQSTSISESYTCHCVESKFAHCISI